jgi:Nucleotidyl transferase AbiEii toxin, Type IV TA system
MKYTSATAFRQALDDRLKTEAQSTGLSLGRLRKRVAFELFLRRLVAVAPDRWVLKGAFALDLRLDVATRPTKDIDLNRDDDEQDAIADMTAAQQIVFDDYFTFSGSAASSCTASCPKASHASFPTIEADRGRVMPARKPIARSPPSPSASPPQTGDSHFGSVSRSAFAAITDFSFIPLRRAITVPESVDGNSIRSTLFRLSVFIRLRRLAARTRSPTAGSASSTRPMTVSRPHERASANTIAP